MEKQACTVDLCEQLCEHPQVICLARNELPSDDMVFRLADVFKVLGDPTRVKLLSVLSRREMCVCDLAATLSMGQSAISHQLRLLRGARMVKYRKEGKVAWYSLDDDHVVLLMQQAIEHIGHGG